MRLPTDVWLFVSVISFFLMAIYPHVIGTLVVVLFELSLLVWRGVMNAESTTRLLAAPLFNKFTPLEEGELRTAINQLALQVRVTLPLPLCSGTSF